MAHEVTFIPGDGTGPELAEATRRVLEATGVAFAWDEHPAGEDVYHEEGNPFPDRSSTCTPASAPARHTRACARASRRPTS
jgi:isocitrate/isopropylmalate dehydrogenase